MLLVFKKLLQGKKISNEYTAKDYLQDFNSISQALLSNLDFSEWIEIYLKLVNWDLELDAHPEVDLRQTLTEQKREANKQFSKFVENNYRNWLFSKDETDSPILSDRIVSKYVKPFLKDGKSVVFFFVLDCLRVDQWMVM